MGKVTFLSFPPTCCSHLLNCVCLAFRSRAPLRFSVCISFLVWRISVPYHGLRFLCVCGNSCSHILIMKSWAAMMCSPAARKASLATADSRTLWAIMGASGPSWLGEPYLAGSWAKLQRALAVFPLFSGLMSPLKFGPQVQQAVT